MHADQLKTGPGSTIPFKAKCHGVSFSVPPLALSVSLLPLLLSLSPFPPFEADALHKFCTSWRKEAALTPSASCLESHGNRREPRNRATDRSHKTHHLLRVRRSPSCCYITGDGRHRSACPRPGPSSGGCHPPGS